MTRPQLKTRFCERFQCPETEYEKRALRHCLYSHTRLLAPLLRLLNPKCFEPDLKMVRFLGEVTGRRDAVREALTFQDANLARPTFLRNILRLRASGRKASALAEQLFPPDAD